MLHAGLDLSRRRLDVHLMDQAGEQVEVAAVPPDADGLRGLAWQVGELGQPVRAAIESMAATWFPRSGCRPQGCGPSGNGPASGCTWSATGPR
jgi:hypothetical protein